MRSATGSSLHAAHLQNMQIHAVSTGMPEYNTAFEAVIHSAFSTSINLEVEGQDTLTAIFASDDRDQPGDIRVSSRDGGFTEGLYPGQKVRYESGRIVIEGSKTCIDLRQARRADCQMPVLPCPSSQGSRAALRAIRECLENEKAVRASGFQVNKAFEARLSAGVNGLSGAAKRLDLRQAEKAARRLIGLGQGLTPSGDDILVGFLAGLIPSCAEDPARKRFLASFSRVAAALAVETNAISRTYLVHASQGCFSTALIRFVKAVCLDMTPAEVTAAALKVLRTGHSSGMDMMTGLLAAMEL